MIIDIYPGKYFCRWKLLFATNIYFHQSMFERFVGSKDVITFYGSINIPSKSLLLALFQKKMKS